MGDKPYLPDCRISSGSVGVTVYSPSVKSRSGWVKRNLSAKELCDVYDLQVDVAAHIVGKEHEASVLPIVVSSAPEKVSHCCASNWLELHSVELDKVSGTSSTSTTLNDVEPVGQPVQWYVDEDMELNDEKAARNDDVEADVGQWDTYIVREYCPLLEWQDFIRANPDFKCPNDVETLASTSSPLVCVGLEVTDAHRNLFNGLRRLCLRRYRRNLMRSFRRYLSITYGNDWFQMLLSMRLGHKKSSEFHCTSSNQGYGRFAESVTSLHKKAWTNAHKDMWLDVKVALEAMKRVLGKDSGDPCSENGWWDWEEGSSLFFWRWPSDIHASARDGERIWQVSDFPSYKAKQKWPNIPAHKSQMIEKIIKVVRRGYVGPGAVVSLTGFFAVPKGLGDIRMVYDATKCGLNDTIWAPTFLLPTIDDTLRLVPIGGWMSDIDLGEMFLNFPLDERIRKYAGVDLTEIKEELRAAGISLPAAAEENISSRLFLRWARCLMGLRSSPFIAVRFFAWADEVIRGDPHNIGNIFHALEVRLNLPGMKDYDPSQPKVALVDENGVLIPNFDTYIDDIRNCGATNRACVRCARRVASITNYLGMQDAPRKRRFPSRNPGVWSGAKSLSTETGLYTATTQEKWDKGKAILQAWKEESETNNGLIGRESMMRGRGFLIHLSRTYPAMVPHLKGIHHAIDAWRPGRDKDGWKLNATEWKAFLEDVYEIQSWKDGNNDWKDLRNDFVKGQVADAPPSVDTKKIARFPLDLEALLSLMKNKRPPRRLVRGKQVLILKYGFGDASGGGFGASWEHGQFGIKYRFGVWNEKENEGKSSNYRELFNLVETLEHMANTNELKGVELYFFTDNAVAARSYFKGSSKSRLLHDLVFRLRSLEINFGCKIHLIHVSGTRMIAQGSDGLSRGNMAEGVMSGTPMSAFVPLHLTALERESKLLPWLESWLIIPEDPMRVEVLSPFDWFYRGHDHLGGSRNCDGIWFPQISPGLFVWSPAPGAAEVALKQLRKARLKRTLSTHVVVIPRIQEPDWRSHLHKAADLVLEIPVGQDYWPSNMHEPLILALFFPYIKHRPWTLKGAPTIVELGRRLSRMWKEGAKSEGTVLRKLRRAAFKFQSMSPKLVFKLLRSSKEYDLSHF